MGIFDLDFAVARDLDSECQPPCRLGWVDFDGSDLVAGLVAGLVDKGSTVQEWGCVVEVGCIGLLAVEVLGNWGFGDLPDQCSGYRLLGHRCVDQVGFVEADLVAVVFAAEVLVDFDLVVVVGTDLDLVEEALVGNSGLEGLPGLYIGYQLLSHLRVGLVGDSVEEVFAAVVPVDRVAGFLVDFG